jgi:hypothetical protein
MAPLDRAYGARARSPLRYIAPHNHPLRQQCAGDLWTGGEAEAAVVTDIPRVGLALDELYEGAPGPPLIDRAIVDDLVRCGSYVLSVNQSTKLIHEGLKDRDIYIVLDGEVFIETGVGRRAVATRGDVVGEFALFLPLHRRSKSAYARRAKILVIKQGALESLKARSPRRYIALIETLAQRIIAKLSDWEYASDESPPHPLRQADP